MINETSDSNESVHSEPSYFAAFSKDYLVNALKVIITQASLSAKHGMYKAECILPYRLLRVLIDKPELGLPALDEVMFDLACCLKQQISNLGGLGTGQTRGAKLVKLRGTTAEEVSKKPTKKGALKAEILQSSNLFFSSLDSEVLFRWMTDLLRGTFSQLANRVSEDAVSKLEQDKQPVMKEKAEENLEEGEPDVRMVNHEGSHSSSPIVELGEVQLTDKMEHEQQENMGVTEEGEGEERRNDQSPDQKTSNRASISESSVVTTVDNKRDFSFVLELIKFLIQSLPLVRETVACPSV